MATQRCGACGSLNAEFACSRCKAARYCSQGCFRAAWPSHKAVCGKVPEESKESKNDESKKPTIRPWPSRRALMRLRNGDSHLATFGLALRTTLTPGFARLLPAVNDPVRCCRSKYCVRTGSRQT
eukprot:Skav218374  [mRNA]  locus=scaffold2066:217101:219419:+ [translate_table: standard]